MSARRASARVAFGLMAVLATIAACRAQGGAGGAATATAPDTTRGVVSIVGSEPLSTLIVTPANGSADDVLAPRGDDLALLRRVAGLEVVLVGRRSEDFVPDAGPRGARAFDLVRFMVRAADGRPAIDGVLGEEGGRYFLTTADGTQLAIAALPTGLASQVGARVYLVGAPGAAPTAYGVIRAAR